MRVAMVGPFGLQPKGTMAVRALPLAKALARRGHMVCLVLPPWSFPEDAGRSWDEDGVQIANTSIAPQLIIPLHLVRFVRSFRPEVVHVFKPKGHAGIAQWLLWQMRRVGMHRSRIVLDEDDWEGAGGWNDREPYPQAYKQFFAWQERWGLTHADAITVASRALETIAWSLGITPAVVSYLPNGVTHLPASVESGADIRRQMGLGANPTILLYTRFFEFDRLRVSAVLT
jgi:hypothetical protein